jgi:hypothetical protein
MQFLQEVTEKIDVITESEGKNMFISGVTLQSEIKNKNGRIYPKRVLSEAVGRHMQEFMEDGRALGELNHPTENASQINLENVSHRFVEVQESGNDFVTKALILNTDSGKLVRNLIEGGVKLGISSRGFGNITTESDGTKLVESLYLVSLGDIVANPSAPNAFLSSVMEGYEWAFENGVIVQKEKQIDEKLEIYKNIIENTSKTERADVIKGCFADYFETLLSK